MADVAASGDGGSRHRWRAVGGIVGPAVFIAAWTLLGLRREGYSPVADPISRLAADDAPTRWAMTAGFVSFSAGVSLCAAEVRNTIGAKAAGAAATSAVATMGIALTPLGSTLGGAPHAAFAGVAYASLAAAPLLARRPLQAARELRRARAATVAGVVTGAALLASVATPRATGLFQRLGLTVGDLWIMATAWQHLRPPTAGVRSSRSG